MSESLKQKTVRGVMWSGISHIANQAIQFLFGLLVARILTPHEYGLVGMVLVFTSISGVFVDSGFSTALVRKPDRTDADFSTAFHFNIVMALVIYLIIFFAAPLIAQFYDEPQLTAIARVIALNIIIGSFGIVQHTQYTIKMDFKTTTKVSIISLLASGTTGVAMAYSGFGVWAIVGQFLVNKVVSTFLIWFVSSWRPLRVFSKDSFRYLWNFGYKMTLSALLDVAYSNIYQIIIGKIFSPKDLGDYARARQFANLPSVTITGILGGITFPALSSIQNDDARLEHVYRKFLRLAAFIVFPLMVGLAALAEPVILFLLTDKWSAAIVLLQIICFNLMWYPIHAINLHLLQVKGRSDLFLRLEIIKKIIGVIVLCISVPMGLKAMCVSGIFSSLLCLFVNTYYTGKLINVGYWRQMRDLFPILLLSLAMGAVVVLSIYLLTSNLLKLIVGFTAGVLFYLLVAYLFRMGELTDLLSLLQRKK